MKNVKIFYGKKSTCNNKRPLEINNDLIINDFLIYQQITFRICFTLLCNKIVPSYFLGQVCIFQIIGMFVSNKHHQSSVLCLHKKLKNSLKNIKNNYILELLKIKFKCIFFSLYQM